eukprot:6208354-Pleurochrysis_carterae.AAC.3
MSMINLRAYLSAIGEVQHIVGDISSRRKGSRFSTPKKTIFARRHIVSGLLHIYTESDGQFKGELGLLVLLDNDTAGGLFDNNAVSDKAVEVSVLEEGRIVEGKVVGVLVGKHAPGFAGFAVNVAHYVHCDACAPDKEACCRPRPSRAASGKE